MGIVEDGLFDYDLWFREQQLISNSQVIISSSQTPRDFPKQIPLDTISSTSKRHLRIEEQPFECHTQPWLDSDPQQASLTSLRSLHPSARALVIVLESEVLLIDGPQVVFEGSFEITMKSKW